MKENIELGPQYPGDNKLAARLRLHQSWCRGHILEVPWGTGPGPKATSPWGSMLTREDGAAGRNFLTPEIFALATDRADNKTGTVDEYRLLHNMLSSQPMCFNLFGYLGLYPSLATRTFRALAPDVAEVTEVRIEYAPEPAKDYLADRTAFDAFVEYRRQSGGLGFFGIETKLSEPFSQKEYDTAVYRRWTERPSSPWHPEGYPNLQRKAHNQLWRNHLLVYALQEQSDYERGTIVVTGHPLDTGLEKTIAGYRELLVDPEELRVWSVDRIMEAAEAAIETGAHNEWLVAFRTRYLEMDLSEEAWQAHRAARRRR